MCKVLLILKQKVLSTVILSYDFQRLLLHLKDTTNSNLL